MIKIKGEDNGGVAVKDRPKAAVQKTRTASPSPKTTAGGSSPPEKPPLSAAAAGVPQPRGGAGLAPPFLTQVDFDTLVWLEERRKALGLRSRAEVIRGVLTAARAGK